MSSYWEPVPAVIAMPRLPLTSQRAWIHTHLLYAPSLTVALRLFQSLTAEHALDLYSEIRGYARSFGAILVHDTADFTYEDLARTLQACLLAFLEQDKAWIIFPLEEGKRDGHS